MAEVIEITNETAERWFVWTKKGRKPSYVHDSELAAMNEAHRLAALHPGQKFHVMRSVCKVGSQCPRAFSIAVSELGAGDFVTTDAALHCANDGQKRLVINDGNGLYIKCADGKHFLDGQLSEDRTHYIGLRKVAQ